MARRNDDAECETETWLIRNHIESYFHIFVYPADNMKRENEDNYEEPQQQIMDNMAQEQGTDNDESQDAINDTNNFNQNNQDNGGGPNPPKRQRRNDDEEIRLLIPSKVWNYPNLILVQLNPFSLDSEITTAISKYL